MSGKAGITLVCNGHLTLDIPHSFDNRDVEVIILPVNQVDNEHLEKKVDPGLFGSLHQYANPRMINGEKNAWSDAVEEQHSKCTTRFNVAELYVGIYKADDSGKEQKAVEEVLRELELFEFDDFGAQVSGRLTSHLQSLGKPTGDMDVLIAATALANNDPMTVTRNPIHYADLPGLRVESYRVYGLLINNYVCSISVM